MAPSTRAFSTPSRRPRSLTRGVLQLSCRRPGLRRARCVLSHPRLLRRRRRWLLRHLPVQPGARPVRRRVQRPGLLRQARGGARRGARRHLLRVALRAPLVRRLHLERHIARSVPKLHALLVSASAVTTTNRTSSKMTLQLASQLYIPSVEKKSPPLHRLFLVVGSVLRLAVGRASRHNASERLRGRVWVRLQGELHSGPVVGVGLVPLNYAEVSDGRRQEEKSTQRICVRTYLCDGVPRQSPSGWSSRVS